MEVIPTPTRSAGDAGRRPLAIAAAVAIFGSLWAWQAEPGGATGAGTATALALPAPAPRPEPILHHRVRHVSFLPPLPRDHAAGVDAAGLADYLCFPEPARGYVPGELPLRIDRDTPGVLAVATSALQRIETIVDDEPNGRARLHHRVTLVNGWQFHSQTVDGVVTYRRDGKEYKTSWRHPSSLHRGALDDVLTLAAFQRWGGLQLGWGAGRDGFPLGGYRIHSACPPLVHGFPSRTWLLSERRGAFAQIPLAEIRAVRSRRADRRRLDVEKRDGSVVTLPMGPVDDETRAGAWHMLLRTHVVAVLPWYSVRELRLAEDGSGTVELHEGHAVFFQADPSRVAWSAGPQQRTRRPPAPRPQPTPARFPATVSVFPGPPPRPPADAAAGHVRGQVVFSGVPPPAWTLALRKDTAVCGTEATVAPRTGTGAP